MTKKNASQPDKPEDIAEDFFDKETDPAPKVGLGDGLELSAPPDSDADAEAMLVSLNQCIYGGEDCVEVYAHGEAYPKDGTEKTRKTVLLARVTERALTMFPLVSASYRPTFLTPKYDELTTITVLAEEGEPWWLPRAAAATPIASPEPK